MFVPWLVCTFLYTFFMFQMLCTFPLMHRFRGHTLLMLKIANWAMTSRNIDTVYVLIHMPYVVLYIPYAY